jgi:CrcB protein
MQKLSLKAILRIHKEDRTLRKYIYLSCGGFTGAILRYLIEQVKIPGYYGNIPINTLLINISGAFLMAFILAIAFEVWEMDADIRLGITTGFWGAYTTFSTLCKESVGLMQNGYYLSAVSYITVSIVLGLGAAYLGTLLARRIGTMAAKRRKASAAEDLEEAKESIEEESEMKE